MKGILHNNVFEENVKKITLHLEGRTASPYQQITMYQNYITRSDVDHEPVIFFYQVKTFKKKLKYKDFTDQKTESLTDRKIERQTQIVWLERQQVSTNRSRCIRTT
jgi:hypothetical protein